MYRRLILLGLLAFSAGSSLFAQEETPPASELVTDNNQFAFDLYRALHTQEGNLFFAPFSISQAFAMVHLGAGGTTADEIADVMHYTLPPETLHPGMQALADNMVQSASDVPDYYEIASPEQGPGLSIINSLWGEQTFTFEDSYLQQLAELYQAELQPVDFINAPEPSRQLINQWIADQTMQRIPEALPANTLTPDTKLILVNAVYFKNFWLETFDAAATEDAPFTLLDGSQITVPMMFKRLGTFVPYYLGEDYQMVEVRYEFGDFSMVIFVPEDFATFEANFTADVLQAALDNSFNENSVVELRLPRFRIDTTLQLDETLQAMGMTTPFNKDLADFTAVTPTQPFWIEEALHKTFIAVDEFGTEAGGATIVQQGGGGGPELEVAITVDRPFIFLIRDRTSGTILFMGRVLEPEGGRELVPQPTPTPLPG